MQSVIRVADHTPSQWADLPLELIQGIFILILDFQANNFLLRIRSESRHGKRSLLKIVDKVSIEFWI